MSKEYCWMFGEHKSDPCPCGYPDAIDREIISLHKQLKEQSHNLDIAIGQNEIIDAKLEMAMLGLNYLSHVGCDGDSYTAKYYLAEIDKLGAEK